jgi:hypothetical protein
MNPSVVAALVGLFSALVASVVTGYVGYRRLRTEVHAQIRKDYITRQIAACEEIWRHLLPLSEYPSSTSILLTRHAPHQACPALAKAFCEDITAVFFTPAGLYVSRDVRFALFTLRAVLTKELIRDAADPPGAIGVSAAFVKRFRTQTARLFTVIRNEVGAVDLRVVRQGPME